MNIKDKSLSSISIEEYRKLMLDQTSSDVQILQRLQYIEAICRNVIREELRKFSEPTIYERK